MSRTSLTIGLLASVLLVSPARADGWRVGLRGIGPVRVGMTLEEASSALGERLRVVADNAEVHCAFATARRLPQGVHVMVLHGRIERIDVVEGATRTLSGAGIGSTEADVMAIYPGKIVTQGHPYMGPDGHYLVFVAHDASDAEFGLIFETDGKRVTSFRAGRLSAVGLIEGCS